MHCVGGDADELRFELVDGLVEDVLDAQVDDAHIVFGAHGTGQVLEGERFEHGEVVAAEGLRRLLRLNQKDLHLLTLAP